MRKVGMNVCGISKFKIKFTGRETCYDGNCQVGGVSC